MKRIFFYILVLLLLVVFFWVSFDQSTSMKIIFTSKDRMAPNPSESTFVEISKSKPHRLPSIPPILEDLQNRLPNLPVFSWLRMKNMDNKDSADDSRCSIYPDIMNIEYSNKYWQIFKSENATFYLYSAILGIKTNKNISNIKQ